jgi:aminopeptidase
MILFTITELYILGNNNQPRDYTIMLRKKGEIMDSRIKQLAARIVNYSCEVKAGEKVYINSYGFEAKPLIRCLIKEVYEAGAYPYVKIEDMSVLREIMLGCNQEQLGFLFENELEKVKAMDVYIGIGASENAAELKDVPMEKLMMFTEAEKKVVEERNTNCRYLALRYPNNSLAQKADMSLEGFEDFVYKVCNLDYEKMSTSMDRLADLMERTDRVRIISPGTDLSFSIKGITSFKCDGKHNLPDGELFTAPVRNSVNGHITFNTSTTYGGFTFKDVYLEFKDGRIVCAKANDSERINKILDSDEGARYIGEFAIGVNPYIVKPMDNILYDEKISGSIHLTPGMAYKMADNGNESRIHWDMVLIQTPECGGGEIYFDDVLIRKDGKFVVSELEALNPELLK